MASKAPLDFDDYRAYEGSTNPTTQAQFQNYTANQNDLLIEILNTLVWLPGKAYSVGDVVYCGAGLWAKCTTGGTSGTTEPSWSTGTKTDGTVMWSVTETISTLVTASTNLSSHTSNRSNPHGVTKAQVGLGSVVNTGDSATPVSGGATKFTTGGAYTELAKKVDKAQGSGNAGKVMGVGSDGNMTLVTALPIGAVVWLAGNAAIPDGYLLCNGQAVSRTTYANLYSSIGTTYGTGDGSTTFNLPNLIDKFIEGSSTAGTVKAAGLPNITGTFWDNRQGGGSATGAFYDDSRRASGSGHSSAESIGITFDASRSSSIYGNSSTVQPPALTMKPVIKF